MESAKISFPLFGEGFATDAPRYFTIFGYNIYLYGLFITAGFVLAALYLLRRSKDLDLTKDNVLDLVIMAVPFGLIGARIYFMAFNASHYFGPGKWQNILMIREGGLAVYGGIIGGGIAFFVYSMIKKIPVGKLVDAAGFGLFIGQAVGRWGNFVNREAFGVETTLPWRMGFTLGARTIYVHPTFLYESLWNIVGFILLHIFSKKRGRRYNGQYFLLYVAWYGLGRFMIESLRTDSLYIQGTDVRASQLLAGLSFSISVIILIRNYLRSRVTGAVPEEGPEDDSEETPDEDETEEEEIEEEDEPVSNDDTSESSE